MSEIVYDRDNLVEGRTYLIRYQAGSRLLRRRLVALDRGVYLEYLQPGPDLTRARQRAHAPARRIFIGEEEFISAVAVD